MVYGLYTREVGMVGWVQTYSDKKAERSLYGRAVCLSVWNPGSKGRRISFDMTLTREEALELGRALVASYSIRPEED